MPPKKNHFNDEKKLVSVTAKYMFDNSLVDLEGSYRPEKNHFKNILSQYNGSRCNDALANLYTKWKRNDKNYRTNVQNMLSVKDEEILCTNKKANEYHILFSSEEWKKLSESISIGKRKKFISEANHILANKLRDHGFECYFKLTNNSFSTAKKNFLSKKFWSGVFKCQSCGKDARAFIKKTPIVDFNILLQIFSDNKNCENKETSIKESKRLCGIKRLNLMNEIFSKGPANFRNEAFATGDKDKQNISFANIRKMSSQHRHRHQLSHNFLADADSAKNVFDLMLPRKDFKSIKGFIQEIQSNPFGVLLISDIQAKLWALIKEKDPIWYFDATGSIMAKLPNQKETLLFSIVANDSKNKTSISVADFLTSSNDTISIHCYLTKILQKFGLYSFFEKPRVVVTDFSWANLHALCKSFNNLEIIDYLNLTYQILVERKIYAIGTINTVIYLCSTHFLKNIIDETERVLKYHDPVQRGNIKRKFIKAFLLLQNSICLDEFGIILKSIKYVFTSKLKDKNYIDSLARLEIFYSSMNADWIKTNTLYLKPESSRNHTKIFFVENRYINFTRDSPFSKYFENILMDPIDDNSVIHDLENNSLFFPELFLIIKKKLHLAPLWSGVMLKIKELDQTRLSNNYVEGWFSYFKTKILKINKSVRNCRKLYTNEIATPLFFEIKRKYSTFYEDRFNILYEKTDKQDHYLGDKISTEKYSFRNPKKSTADYYNSNFSFLNNEEDSIKESVKNKKLNDLGISEYFDDNNLFDSDSIEDENNSESDFGEHENSSEMVVDENSSDIPIEKKEDGLDSEPNKDIFEKNGKKKDDLYYYKIGDLLITKREIGYLLDDDWLSDSILEACGKIFIRNSKKVGILMDSYQCNHLCNKGKLINDEFLKIEKMTFICGFYCQNNNHWCLIFIDLKSNYFYYIDPKGEVERKCNQIFNNWKMYFIKKFNRNLVLKKKQHTKQKDSINCGIFVCLFLQQFLEGKELKVDNSKSYLEKQRTYISYLLKQNSKNTFCSYCGCDFKIEQKVLKFECEHRFHETCSVFGNRITLDLSKEKFYCPICH